MCFPGTMNPSIELTAPFYFDPTNGFLPPDAFKKCHLHTKPRLTCKYCRKYKSALVTSKLLQHQARLTHQQETLRNISNYTPLIEINDTTSSIEMTNTTTYNVNNLLRENILSSEYYKSLYDMKSYLEIVNELCNYADHAEPYCAGSSRAPSTLFCGLYKLFTLRLKQHEIQSLLEFSDSAYVRCAGFLYLRYVLPPEKLWEWFCPYFLDDDSFSPGVEKQKLTTIGEYAERLMTDDRYFSTVLPRIPVKVKSHYGAQLMPMPSHRKRRASNKANIDQFKPGINVAACVHGEWVEGVLVSVEDPTSGQAACQIQIGDDEDYIELVDLGLVIILTAKFRKLKRQQERHNRQFTLGQPPLINRKYKAKIKNRKTNRTSSLQRNGGSHESFSSSKRDYSEKSPRSTSNSNNKRKHQQQESSYYRSISRSRSQLSESNDSTRNIDISPRSKRYKERYNYFIRKNGIRPQNLNELSGLTEQDMLKEFKRREQAKALASGKDYARRPTSYKSSLSLRFSGTAAKSFRTLSPPVRSIHKPPPDDSKNASTSQTILTQEQSAEYQERLAQLMKR